MSDRVDRIEDKLREEIKEINVKLTDIQVSLEVLKSKQNTGVCIFKFMLTVVVASISGIFGSYLYK